MLMVVLWSGADLAAAQSVWTLDHAGKQAHCGYAAQPGESLAACLATDIGVLKAFASGRSAGKRSLSVPLPTRDLRLMDVSVSHAGENGITLKGRLERERYATFSVTFAAGTAVGSFQEDGVLFEVRPVRGGGAALIEVDQRVRRMSSDDVVTPADPGQQWIMPAASVEAGPVEIDLLLLWDDGIVEKHGLEAVQAMEAHFVGFLNQVVANGGNEHIRFRVVHSQVVPWPGSGFLHLDLDWLKRSDDGVLDDVHALRRKVKADIVHLFSDFRVFSTCGVAYRTLSDASHAFGVSSIDGCEMRSFAHEIGHNLGMGHDPFVSRDEVQTWQLSNHGHVDKEGAFYTRMSYDQECQQHGVNCTSVPYFSDPDRTLDGVPLGTPDNPPFRSANNARVLRENAAVRAAYSDLLSSCPAKIYKGSRGPASVRQGDELSISIPMGAPEADSSCTFPPSYSVYLRGSDQTSYLVARHAVEPTETPEWIGFTGTSVQPVPPSGAYQVFLVNDANGSSYDLNLAIDIVPGSGFDELGSLPAGIRLLSLYPNPLNPQAQLSFTTDGSQEVRVRMVDMLGRQRLIVEPGRVYPAGLHTVQVDGASLPSGVYMLVLEAGNFHQTKPVTLLR